MNENKWLGTELKLEYKFCFMNKWLEYHGEATSQAQGGILLVQSGQDRSKGYFVLRFRSKWMWFYRSVTLLAALLVRKLLSLTLCWNKPRESICLQEQLSFTIWYIQEHIFFNFSAILNNKYQNKPSYCSSMDNVHGWRTVHGMVMRNWTLILDRSVLSFFF